MGAAMTKSTAFLLCIACLVVGFYYGQHSLDENEKTKTPMYQTLLTDMTSQGRAGMRALQKKLLSVEAPAVSDIYFNQTRVFKEIAAENPDKALISRLSEKTRADQAALQARADEALIQTLLSLPLHDRETYLRHYLRHKNYLTEILIVQPLMTEIKYQKEAPTGRPRDAVMRKTNVPEL